MSFKVIERAVTGGYRRTSLSYPTVKFTKNHITFNKALFDSVGNDKEFVECFWDEDLGAIGFWFTMTQNNHSRRINRSAFRTKEGELRGGKIAAQTIYSTVRDLEKIITSTKSRKAEIRLERHPSGLSGVEDTEGNEYVFSVVIRV